MPKQVQVGTWIELKQKESDDLSTLAGVETKPIKHLDGQEKEKYDRQARKQKVRQKTTFKKR
jgi:23S rRNA pseudouridine2605 synthase